MSRERTKRLFLVWISSVVSVAVAVVAAMALSPIEVRQMAIPIAYAVITCAGLIGGGLLYRLSWRMLRDEGNGLPAKLAFAMATILICEALEQGWWTGIRLYRYSSGGFASPALYDHWIIASWTVGLAASIAFLIPLVSRR